MKVHHRSFDEHLNDFRRMWRFLQQEYAQRQDRYVWHASRLGDWKYGLWDEEKYIPSFFRNHAELWLDAFDRLLGFVLNEGADNIFFIFTLPGYEYLYADILDWTIEHWRGRHPSIVAEVHEYQKEALAALESRGFRSEGAIATTRQYDLPAREAEPIQLPEGFRIVNLQENGDYRNKGLLYKAGFDDEDQVSDFDLLRFEYSRENPAYDPRFDLSVVTPEGIHAAGCVGFYDPAEANAEVEKVCTHNQYRRLGLAEAVTRECLQRLKRIGIRYAYITSYGPAANALYEKLGPCSQKRWFHYELASNR